MRRSGGDTIQMSRAPHHGEMPMYASTRATLKRRTLSPDNTREPARLVDLTPQLFVLRAAYVTLLSVRGSFDHAVLRSGQRQKAQGSSALLRVAQDFGCGISAPKS